MCSPTRILHLIDRLDGFGRAGQLRMLIDAQIEKGQHPEVLALNADARVLDSWNADGIRCQQFDRRWQWDPFMAWHLSGFFRLHDYDLLHTWDHDSLIYAHYAGPAGRMPTVATLWKVPASSRRLRQCLPRHVVTPTPQPMATMTVSPAVTASDGPFRSRVEFLSEQSLPGDAQLIAVGGQLVRENRIDEAIWCFELIRAIHPQVRLLILGEGPDRPRLERFTRLVSDSHVVRFLGDRDDIRELLPMADVVWSMGEDRFAFPLSVLEAMAAGVPVVAVDDSAIGQMILDKEAGLTVPLDDRAKRAVRTMTLLEDKQQAKAIATPGQLVVQETFGVDKMISAYDEAYEDALTAIGDQYSSKRNETREEAQSA